MAEYDHATGCSVTGVGDYLGDKYVALDGVYFAADYCSGIAFGLNRDDGGAWQFEELLQTGVLATGSGHDDDGNRYITAFESAFDPETQNPAETPRGVLWMIVAADQVLEGAEVAPPPVEEEEEEPTPTPEPSPEASPSA